MLKVHIVTPDGQEIASTAKIWRSMPIDWRSLASCFTCPNCTTKIGEEVDHAAGTC